MVIIRVPKVSYMLFMLQFLSYMQMTSSAPAMVDVISPPVNGTNLTCKCLQLLLKPYGGWKQVHGPHLTYSQKENEFYLKNKCKIIFPIRDPRDRVVSYAYKVKKLSSKAKGSIPDLTYDVITQYGMVNYNYLVRIPFYKNMGDFSEYYKMYFPWFDYPDLLFVFFEDLVGPKAGGSAEKQLAAIRTIAQFIGVDASEQEIEYIADNLWGDTASFRDPKIGRWKDVFTDRHKKAFKSTCMAQFLIDFGYETDTLW
jgi:hypothetical protein